MGTDVPVSSATLKGSAMTEKTANVHWAGAGKNGQGHISTETGALERYTYGFASRFDDACLDFACEKAGFTSQRVDTQAHGRLSPKGAIFEIDRIILKLSAAVPGIDEVRFQEIALTAKRECPLSKALAAVAEIRLQTTLEAAAK
jgi:osmotically inducible protein OsmC